MKREEIVLALSSPYEGTVFDRQRIDDDHCFLCGSELTTASRSDEHIIPRWLQRRFDLYNCTLTLPNGTSIPYHKLVIPCCRTCNEGPLSRLEAEIKTAMAGFRQFCKLPKERVFQWCTKMFYGLLYRDTQLLSNRANRDDGTIADKQMLEGLFTLHLFLQSLHVPFHFNGFVPHSLFIVETQELDARKFDLHDISIIVTPSSAPKLACVLALRCDDIRILCVFMDNGAQKKFFQKWIDDFNGIPLRPLQFIELFCRSVCKEYSRNFSSRYQSGTTLHSIGPVVVNLQPHFLSGPLWGEFDVRLCNRLMVQRGRPFMSPELLKDMEEIAASEKGIMCPSFLWDENGNPMRYVDGKPRATIILPKGFER